MIGWAIALGVLGGVAATGVAAVTGGESDHYVRLWMSYWWAWAPFGLLIGFFVGRTCG